MDDLSVKLAAGVEERSEAETADRTHQEILAEARSAYADFHLVLQAFRKGLGAVVGRDDKDLQKLRVQRAAERDEEDDPGASEPELPGEPGDDDDEIAA